ncbi:hypothetical protein MRY82_06850 [bacterium]|nr:hypothetical protein [bacterium]
MLRKYFLILIACSLTLSWAKDRCFERIVALDIGSGSTKMSIGRRNVCQSDAFNLSVAGQDIKVYSSIEKVDLEAQFDGTNYSDSIKVDYAEALEQDLNSDDIPDGMIDAKTLNKGLNAIKIFLQYAKLEKHAYQMKNPGIAYEDKYVAVATSAFRTFEKNAPKAAKRAVKQIKNLGFDEVSIISQEQEAALGFISALVAKGVEDPKNTLVWDIGGASTQLIAANHQGEVQVIGLGNVASVDFRRQVVEQKPEGWEHSFDNGKSQPGNPNPIGSIEGEKERVIELSKKAAEDISYQGINALSWIEQNPITTVIGVGSVLKYGGYYRLNSLGLSQDNSLTPELMNQGLDAMVDYNENKDYAEGNVSNMYLIYGHMLAFGFDQVQCFDVTMADALLSL